VTCYLTPGSTARNRVQSPLLRLPGEIRNQIYGHAFAGKMISLAYRGSFYLYDAESEKRETYTLNELVGATTTCHQVRSETTVLPFRYNEFESLRQALPKFLSKLQKEQRNAMVSVKVHIGALDDHPDDVIDHPDHIIDDLVWAMGLHTMRGLKRLRIELAPGRWEHQIKKTLSEILAQDVKVEYSHWN
jgi:hypothetical protein